MAWMTSWRRSGVTAVIVISAFLIVQLTIPISRIGVHENALRFGWQMFSTARETPAFVVETPEGSIEIDINEYMAGARGDVDIIGGMPQHLCQVVPGAVRIKWESGEYRC